MHFSLAVLVGSVLVGAQATTPQIAQRGREWKKASPVWRGVHLMVYSDQQLDNLVQQVPTLAKAGVNALILEVDYSFQFKKRPEMAAPNGISREAARRVSDACWKAGIRPIPQINCLGHQSWAKATGTLLTQHPEFDETPGQFPENEGIYCRSWCPQHPDVNPLVFDLIDELTDAFQADAFHVGMDEVFLIASEHCPRCKGGDPAQLFAKAVTDLHGHIVKKRKLEMLMWGDRLLDGKATGYGEWEASTNGTAPAIDLVPKDIVVCDWHYERRDSYPSLRIFVDKGFRVWPSAWNKVEATEAFANAALAMKHKRVLGHLCTTWGEVNETTVAAWPPFQAAMRLWQDKPKR